MWRALSKTYQNLRQFVLLFTLCPHQVTEPEINRYHEAIECQKRALIGASKTDTFGPAALAELYEQLEMREVAVEWHKRVIDICVQSPDSPPPSPSQPTSTAATDHASLSQAHASVGLWAKSALAVARFALQKPRWENNVIGGTMIPSVVQELNEAKRFLEIVAASNAGEAGEAEQIMRAIGAVSMVN